MRNNMQQRQFRAAVAMLVGAAAGMAASIGSGLALVPRVRLVDVLTVIGSAAGGGAALAGAIVQFRAARDSARRGR